MRRRGGKVGSFQIQRNGADGTVAACAGASSTGSITDCPVPVKSVY